MIWRSLAPALFLGLLASCAGGPVFWTRPGASLADFEVDHGVCFKDATIGYGIGSEKTYKACMVSKRWSRARTSSGLPDAAHFRGPEEDDEFAAPLSQEQARERILKDEKWQRSFRETGDQARCSQPAATRPPGLICP